MASSNWEAQQDIDKDAGNGPDHSIPPGWKVCPECNGMGEVWVMQANPNLDEYAYPCQRCANTEGLVPIREGEVRADDAGV